MSLNICFVGALLPLLEGLDSKFASHCESERETGSVAGGHDRHRTVCGPNEQVRRLVGDLPPVERGPHPRRTASNGHAGGADREAEPFEGC